MSFCLQIKFVVNGKMVTYAIVLTSIKYVDVVKRSLKGSLLATFKTYLYCQKIAPLTRSLH